MATSANAAAYWVALEDSSAKPVYAGNAVVIDPELTLGDSKVLPSALSSASVRFDAGLSSGDVLSCTEQGAVTCSYDATTGSLLLSGNDSPAVYQAVLRSVAFSSTAGANTSTGPRTLRFTIGPGVQFCEPHSDSDACHYYAFGASSGWWVSKTACSSSFFGKTGYLTTITSAEENDFVRRYLPSAAWVGSSDVLVAGEWRWRTGPESTLDTVGALFWNGGPAADGGAPAQGYYANWAPDHPRAASDPLGENFGLMGVDGFWRSSPPTNADVKMHVCEWGGAFGSMREQVKVTEIITMTANACVIDPLSCADADFDGDGVPNGSDPDASDPCKPNIDADTCTCPCAADACHPGTCTGEPGVCDVSPDATSCDDGVACTSGDVCHGGTCSGSPNTCSDNGLCAEANVCSCSVGYTGTQCDQCAVGYSGYPTCVPVDAGDGDSDAGPGDTGDGDGDGSDAGPGDSDAGPGDGDGDGDSDAGPGDGDGDGDSHAGTGDAGDGDSHAGTGDGDGDGDSHAGTGDGDGDSHAGTGDTGDGDDSDAGPVSGSFSGGCSVGHATPSNTMAFLGALIAFTALLRRRRREE